MDTAFAHDVRTRMSLEQKRSSPPPSFPKLPDIPLGRYVDETLYRSEVEHVFKRSWLFVGHVGDLPQPGSYRTLDVPFAPVVLVRGLDGQVRAFLNACRHRGAPVVRDACGTAPRLLQCQFHAWSYDLEGQLVGVPDRRDFVGLDPADRGLVPVRCELWGGFVFINMDPDTQPLQEWVAPLAAHYDDVFETDLRPISRKSYAIGCNWKVALEAFLEIYHLPVIHSETAAPFVNCRGGVVVLHQSGHSTVFTPFKANVVGESSEVMELFFPSEVPQIPDPSGFYRQANPSVFGFPHLVTPIDVTGFPVLTFWPTAIAGTRIDMSWYGPDWGDGPRADAWERKLLNWDRLMAEDIMNLEPIQHSIECAAHSGIPLNYQERRIWHLHAEVDKMIGDRRIPDHLRVPDLLADHVEG